MHELRMLKTCFFLCLFCAGHRLDVSAQTLGVAVRPGNMMLDSVEGDCDIE